MRRVILLDFSWLCYAYYFSPLNKRVTSVVDGKTIYTGRILGFSQLVKSASVAGNTEIIFCEDHGVGGVNPIMEGYKGGRESHPEVWEGIDDIKSVVACHPHVRFARSSGYEADDMLAILFYKTKQANPDAEVTIYSGDNDLVQLIPQGAKLSRKVQNGQFLAIGPDYLQDKFPEVPIDQILRYRILIGDPSDNIPPVVPRLNRKWILEFVKKWSESSLQDALKTFADTPNGKKVIAAHKQFKINLQLMNLTKYRDPAKHPVVQIYQPEADRDLLVRYQLSTFQDFLTQRYPEPEGI